MNRQNLLEWYRKEKRDLPFRKQRDPYKISISEIMSQQTRIEAILDHYEAFIQLYPDIPALAAADDDQLMKAWQGLGYYSRARNLKKAAQQCMERHNGELPHSKKELMQLAGIGDYTAGAIASIAWGHRETAVDGNVIRVYSRYYWLDQDFSKPKEKKQLAALVKSDLPNEEDMSDWNQALMELGARICIPKTPRCPQCPLRNSCKGAQQPEPGTLPVRAKKAARKVEEKPYWIAAAMDEGRLYVSLHKRPDKGLLAGLMEFDTEPPESFLKQWELSDYTHIFTHREWNLHPILVLTERTPGMVEEQEVIQNAAIPSAFLPMWNEARRILHAAEEPGQNGRL